MANVDHSNLTGSAAVHPAWFKQSSDPGAVGASKGWIDTSSGPPYQLKVRNSTNTAWEGVGQLVTLFNDAEGDAEAVLVNPNDGDSAYASRRNHIHPLGIITTRGDLIRGGTGGIVERYGLGTTGYVLTSDGTDAIWSLPTGGGGSGGGGGGGLVPLQVIGPLSSSQATLPFTSIPQTGYRNLKIKLLARSTNASTNTNVAVQFNGDTGSNYSYEVLADTSAGFSRLSDDSHTQGLLTYVPAASGASNSAGEAEISILDYTGTTFQKSATSLWSAEQTTAAGNQLVGIGFAHWRNVNAITSITLNLVAGSFAAGSYACLYGEMDTSSPLMTPASNLLYQTTLTTTAASIDTGALSQSYKDLQVQIVARSDTAAQFTQLNLRFNGDSGTNYDWQRYDGASNNNSLNFSSAQTTGACGFIAAASATSNVPGSVVISIPNYSGTTFHKEWMAAAFSGGSATSATSFINHLMGKWGNTTGITSIQLIPAAGNFIAGTTVRVYGMPVSAGGASTGTGTRLRISANQSITTATASLINWDTEDNDADQQHYTSSAALSAGTVSKTAGSSTLTGSSTVFTTDLSVGQVIVVPGTADEKRVVIAIASNTSLTVNTPYVNTASGQTCTRNNSAVVFRSPGFYTLETNIYSAALSTGAVTLAYYLNNLTTATSGTAIGQRDPTAINASAGYELVAQRNFNTWDFVEVVWTQNSGGSVNVLADERTHFSVNARPTVIVAVPYVNIQDQKSDGTGGGSFSSGSWVTRTLNTTQSNDSGIASLASNQITLPPGTYEADIAVPAYNVNDHQARLQNITGSATLIQGMVARSTATANGLSNSVIRGRFRLTATSALEVQHRCETTNGTDGLGRASNFTSDGNEVYTVAIFHKVG